MSTQKESEMLELFDALDEKNKGVLLTIAKKIKIQSVEKEKGYGKEEQSD